MKTIIPNLILVLFILIGIHWQSRSQTIEQLFQAGLQKEVGEGELTEAIAIYNNIVLKEDANREVQAKALLHIGSCYQKLGNQEARDAYRRIINEYGEQKEIVEIARSRLSALQSPTADPAFPKSISLQRIWAGSNVDITGSVSNDGKFISYWDHDSGNLGFEDVSSGNTRLLTKEATYEDPMQFTINSTISPDGEKIAYSWFNVDMTYEIRLVDIEAHSTHIIYKKSKEEAYPISWSPSGEKLLFRRFNDSITCQLASLNMISKEVIVLKSFDEGYWMSAFYSPDDKFIAYDERIAKDDGNYDVCIISEDGNDEIKLIEHPANDRLLGWVPQNGALLFISDRSGTWDAWIQPVIDGSASGNPIRILPGVGQVIPLGFTDFNALFYGISSRKYTSILVPLGDPVHPDFGSSTPLLGSKYSVEFSTDGQYIAYIEEYMRPTGIYRPIHLLDRNTGEEKILSEKYAARHLRWSHDGKKILFTGYEWSRFNVPDYYGGIYTYEPGNKETKEIITFPEAIKDSIYQLQQCLAEWSDDDQKIYLINGPGILSVDAIAGSQDWLLKKKGLSSIIRLSPDGGSLLYATITVNDKKGRLNTISLSNGTTSEICSSQEADEFASAVWSLDGKFIFFSENVENGSVFYRVDATGGDPVKIWESEDQNSGMSIDSFGNNIAISNFMQEAEIWIMQNILSALTDN